MTLSVLVPLRTRLLLNPVKGSLTGPELAVSIMPALWTLAPELLVVATLMMWLPPRCLKLRKVAIPPVPNSRVTLLANRPMTPLPWLTTWLMLTAGLPVVTLRLVKLRARPRNRPEELSSVPDGT